MVSPARASEQASLENLMELYLHDFSELAEQDLDVGPDGRFGYSLDEYFGGAERHPFVIRVGEHLAGFALVKRGSEVENDPTSMDVAEFFVMRGYRRRGVGRAAAVTLWDRFPGRWLVRVLETNPHAFSFWETVVSAYTEGAFEVAPGASQPARWRVFRFASRGSKG